MQKNCYLTPPQQESIIMALCRAEVYLADMAKQSLSADRPTLAAGELAASLDCQNMATMLSRAGWKQLVN